MEKSHITVNRNYYLALSASMVLTLALAAFMFPLSHALSLTLGFLLSTVAASLIAGHTVKQPSFSTLIIAVGTFLWMLTLASLAECSVWQGGSLSEPVLHVDDHKYYNWALHYLDGSVPLPKVEFPGYPFIILLIWKLTGASLIWPMVLNHFATLTAIVLTVAIALRGITPHLPQQAHVITLLSTLLMATQMHWVFYGTRLLKEPLLYLSVTLTAYALIGSGSSHSRHSRSDAVLLILGAAIMAVMRTTWMYFILLGILLAAMPRRWQREKAFFFGTTAVVLTFFVTASIFARNPASYSHVAIVQGGNVMADQFINGTNQGIYQRLLGDYFYAPLWHRMLLLPVTMAVQFFIPFPWIGDEPAIFSSILPRFNFVWYAVGAVAIFYYLFLCWRRKFSLGWLALWPALSYLVIAFLTAGTVSRYVLPFAPLFTVVAVDVILSAKDAPWKSLFRRWCCLAVLAVAVVLTVCYLIQHGVFSVA
ncbi:MAG: hypothetical protein IJ626_04445 [Muribaculaceae bacterium]|nr:hypothetical protein [Muribaculaceae bacterium]